MLLPLQTPLPLEALERRNRQRKPRGRKARRWRRNEVKKTIPKVGALCPSEMQGLYTPRLVSGTTQDQRTKRSGATFWTVWFSFALPVSLSGFSHFSLAFVPHIISTCPAYSIQYTGTAICIRPSKNYNTLLLKSTSCANVENVRFKYAAVIASLLQYTNSIIWVAQKHTFFELLKIVIGRCLSSLFLICLRRQSSSVEPHWTWRMSTCQEFDSSAYPSNRFVPPWQCSSWQISMTIILLFWHIYCSFKRNEKFLVRISKPHTCIVIKNTELFVSYTLVTLLWIIIILHFHHCQSYIEQTSQTNVQSP